MIATLPSLVKSRRGSRAKSLELEPRLEAAAPVATVSTAVGLPLVAVWKNRRARVFACLVCATMVASAVLDRSLRPAGTPGLELMSSRWSVSTAGGGGLDISVVSGRIPRNGLTRELDPLAACRASSSTVHLRAGHNVHGGTRRL